VRRALPNPNDALMFFPITWLSGPSIRMLFRYSIVAVSPMPLWLTLVFVFASVLLWCIGTANADDMIALLEITGRQVHGLGLAVWLPSARKWQPL